MTMRKWFLENLGRDFWTRLEEMVEDIQEFGYRVARICHSTFDITYD